MSTVDIGTDEASRRRALNTRQNESTLKYACWSWNCSSNIERTS